MKKEKNQKEVKKKSNKKMKKGKRLLFSNKFDNENNWNLCLQRGNDHINCYDHSYCYGQNLSVCDG